ncbi:MAG: restriction endonuclease subunit S [Methylobacter sp.]
MLQPINNGAEVREYQEQGVAYLRVGDLKNLTIDAMSVVRIDPISAEKGLEEIDFQVDDVLVSRSGSLAITAVVEPEWQDALISSHLIRLRITDARVGPYYLVLFLCVESGKMQIQQRSNGGVQPEISQSALKSIVVPMPPQSVQQEIRRLILSARKLRDLSDDLLTVPQRAVEIAIEQDENAGIAYIKANS